MSKRGEFRAATDQMLEIIAELQTIELEKRSAAVGSPEFVELAGRALDHARLAFRWADLQLKMANEAAARRVAGDGHLDIHLKDVTPGPIDKILALWREAQIRLEIARPGSREAVAAASDIERLREEYQVAHEVTLEHQADDVPAPRAKAE